MITESNGPEKVTDLSATAACRHTAQALRAAADTIGQMPDTELQYKLRQLKEARKARTPHEVLRQQAELDSLELDEAAYTLAEQAHQAGNLPEAARWYRVGAINDFAEASLKLAVVLDSLAAKYLFGPDSPAATREELGLVSEAALWYSRAFASGEIEAAELLDNLIARHDRQPRATFMVASVGESTGTGTCEFGGLRNVVNLPSSEAVAHCGSCRPCMAELIKVRQLIAVIHHQSAGETRATRRPSDGSRGSRRPPEYCAGPAHTPELSIPGQAQPTGSSQDHSKEG
jgi:hypothetical protein